MPKALSAADASAAALGQEYLALLAASASKEGDARLDVLAEAETRLLSGAAVLPTYHSIAVNVVDSDYVEGWFSNALDLHPFKYLGFGERRVRPNVARLPGAAAAAAGPSYAGEAVAQALGAGGKGRTASLH